MAVNPIFYPTRKEILACVRMQDTPEDAVSQTSIDRALLTVRTGFYQKLGATKITTILVTPFTEAPTTDAEIERAQAQLIECDWFHAELLCLLPSLFAASGSRGIDIQQDENPFRLDGQSEQEKLREKLLDKVNQGLAELGADNTVSQFRSAVVDPECPAPEVPADFYSATRSHHHHHHPHIFTD